jgi:hypothetical protein
MVARLKRIVRGDIENGPVRFLGRVALISGNNLTWAKRINNGPAGCRVRALCGQSLRRAATYVVAKIGVYAKH